MEHQRIDAFELWCRRRLLRVPWTARRSNQSILREVNPECSSWSSNILVIWCEQLTHWKSLWCWERLRAEGEEGFRGWDGCLASLMKRHEVGQTLGDAKGQWDLACCSPWGHKDLDMTVWLSNSNNNITIYIMYIYIYTYGKYIYTKKVAHRVKCLLWL